MMFVPYNVLMKRSSSILALLLFGFLLLTLSANCATSIEIDRKMKEASELFEQGHTPESKTIFEGLLSQLEKGGPSSQLGFVLNGLSRIATSEGDYKRAIQLAQQSSAIYHQLGDPGGESHSLNNQGIAEIQTGQYPAAQKSLETSLELSRRAHDAENEVQVLNNLGSSYYFPGGYSEALHRYDAAMVLVDQNSNATWSNYWRQITSFNQATLFQRLGRYEKALQIYRQVEQSSKSLTPGDRAHLSANLGALYRRLGDPYKALDTYRIAQKLYSEQHDVGGELTVLKNLGIVYALDMEDLRQAEKIFGSSILLAEQTHNRREEMQAQLYLAETLFRSGNALEAKARFLLSQSMAAELGTAEEQWKSLYGLGRVAEQAGDVFGAERDFRDAVAIIEKSRSQLQLGALRSEFFADKREVYDALIALLFAKNDIPETFSYLERSRARNFQDRLFAQSREPHAPLSTLTQAQAKLGPATALLEFWASGSRVGLVWCTQKTFGKMVKDLSAQQMKQIHDLLGAMPANLNADWRERLRVLNAILPDDATAFLGIQHVLIVPDGWISYIPFDLLNSPAHPDAVLIEDYDISYLPTAELLNRPQPVERWIHFPWTNELVAFGNPTVSTQEMSESSGDFERRGSQPLRFSGEEIRGIAGFTRGRSQLFLQQSDLKKSFLSPVANQAFLLHVSTHAFADADSPENSRLLFSSASSGGDPDYVFLRELYDLDLSNVRLATISACDTERGKIARGEGVQAFSRALLSAGAASSLTTLWRVDDQQTSEFMKQFYFLALHEHLSKAKALRLTKLKFAHSSGGLASPQLWAAFVLNGDGATPVPSVLSWTKLVLLSLGCVATMVAVGLLFGLRSRRRVNRQHDSRAVVP